MYHIQCNQLSDRSARNLYVPVVKVATYDIHAKENANRPRIKALLATEQYLFRKEPYADGGIGRCFVARDPNSDQVFSIKEIMLKKHRRQEKNLALQLRMGLHAQSNLQKKIDNNAQSICAEACFSKEAERLHGPLRIAVNKKHSRAYLMQNLLSGTAASAVDVMAKIMGRRQPAMFYVAWLALDDLAFLASKNVKHFDISPGNLLYSKKHGAVQLIDFGSSDKGEGSLMPRCSKAQYSPPSQLAWELGDETNDVFSMSLTPILIG